MKKGTLRNIIGDATDPQRSSENEYVAIPHVCNNENLWGAGFVMALSKRWKTPEEEYHKMDQILGHFSLAHVPGYIIVYNMIAQKGVRGVGNKRPLKYDELVRCMSRVKYDILGRSKINNSGEKEFNIVIHCPRFGSDLSGGSWPFILELINDIWLDAGIDVVVYEYKG